MDNLRDKLTLYLVTDRSMTECSLEKAVESAILGGVTIVQLREKGVSYDEFVTRAISIKTICDRYNVPLIINDDIDVCIEANADGVHLGQTDGNIAEARLRLGVDKIIGASARTIEMAQNAELAGADYLGVGAVFGTSTKLDAHTINQEVLRGIARSVDIPVVAIGGVAIDNVAKLIDTGIAGVAVISAILKADNIEQSARNIKAKLIAIL